MPIQKIKSGRIITVPVTEYIGQSGTIFYDEEIGELRLSNGITPGGQPIYTNSTGTNTGTNSGSVVADAFKTLVVSGQTSLVATGSDTLQLVAGAGIILETSANASPYKQLTIRSNNLGNLDGGTPGTVYGGLDVIDGGGI
jgi:hypothetical protein